jgi:hypothetical protein
MLDVFLDVFDVSVSGEVVPGYGVASGRSLDSPYPAGTIEMQMPFFQSLGLDLSDCFAGTINLSIEPYCFKLLNPAHTFHQVSWAPGFPPETFSFCPVQLQFQQLNYPGWLYYPHPETKIGHFQSDRLMEILAPLIPDLHDGDRLVLSLSSHQIQIMSVT